MIAKIQIYFFVAVLLFLAGLNYWQYRQKNNLIEELNNSYALNDTVRNEADRIYARYIQTIQDIHILKNDSTLKEFEIERLVKILDSKNKQLKEFIGLRATWKPDTVIINPDTVYVTDNTIQFPFERESKGIAVSGMVYYPPAQINMTILRKPISLSVSIVESGNNRYETYVQSSDPYLEIASLTGKIIKTNIHEKRRWFSPFIDIGYMKNRGIFGLVGINIWKADIIGEANEKGLDYGGKFTVWSW